MSLRWLPLIALMVLNIAVIPWFLLIFATSLAATRARRRRLGSEEPRSRLLIVIPAHDEESGIATTVQSCRAANYPAALFGVVVIADNCSDRTASVAANAGSRVIERLDPARRSKGYAIEFLLETLLQSGEFESLDALVFIDADTTIDSDLLRYFDQDLREGRDWIQCYYTVANPDQTWRTRLLTYGFSLFNGVMLLGLSALGRARHSAATGCASPLRGLRRRPWRSYGLVEDMEYSWILRVAGEKIAFQPAASVYGAMPGSGGRATASHAAGGNSAVWKSERSTLLPLLRTEQLGWWEKTLSSCELAMPTMTGLMIVYVLVAALDAWAVFASGTRELPFVRWSLSASGLFMTASLCLYTLSPFLAMRLPWKYASSLAFFPFYMSWKLLIALGGRPKQWVRTARESQIGSLG